MHARSALFDLYGDHLSEHAWWAPISAVVRLLGTVDVAAPAVRTAVSRMVREGWLDPAERHGQRGYAATPRARARLEQARTRIYRTGDSAWDRHWHLVTVEHATDRASRARLAAGLGYLGYARLAPQTWIAPRGSEELSATLAAEGVSGRRFTARYAEDDGADLAAALWDLGELGAAYQQFIADTRDLTRALPERPTPELAFARRTVLVHEWRKFLFRDPGLPAEVLPAQWPGREAAVLFDTTASSLLPLARQFVDSCLGADVKTRS